MGRQLLRNRLQITFKAPLLPSCGELRLSAEGGGCGLTGALRYIAVLMSDTATDSGRACWVTSPIAKAFFILLG
jgi:hypothetical protein